MSTLLSLLKFTSPNAHHVSFNIIKNQTNQNLNFKGFHTPLAIIYEGIFTINLLSMKNKVVI